MITKMNGAATVSIAIFSTLVLQPAWAQQTDYPVEIQNGTRSITVDAPPQRAVPIGTQQIEMLLALDLQDRIAGIAFNTTPVLHEYQDALRSVPVLSERNPALEVVLGAEADFAFGTERSFQDVAPLETLAEYGIAAMIPEANVPGATLENVYNDLRNLGIIFDVQPRAEQMIAEMQAQIAEIEAVVANVEEPVEVFIYSADPGADPILTPTQSLQAHLIRLAGGRNIFEDLAGINESVSMEEIIARDPDIIIITDPYGNTTAQEKIAALEANPALSSITAIQEGRYVLLPSPAREAGIRNADGVRQLAEGFYPELFER